MTRKLNTFPQTAFAHAFLALLAAAALSIPASAQLVDKPQPLWPANGVPDAVSLPPETAIPQPVNPRRGGPPNIKVSNVSVPTMTVYHPSAQLDKHVAMLVFPGGGYEFLSYNMEGSEICEWLNTLGVTGVLVKYRVPTPPGGEPGKLPLEDAQRAIRLVRSRAADWRIAPDHVGVLGFSAGANLSALLSTHDGPAYAKIDDADAQPTHPDFAMLLYPGGILAKGTNNLLTPNFPVTSAAPPTFLVQAENDALIDNSVAYFLALQAAKVPAELHIYADGGHGFGMRSSPYPVSHWGDLAAVWLKTIHMLP